MNSRNGYRAREWDTRAGTIELAIPKLRRGSYFPGFPEHRRRAGRALASVVATSYLPGVSTRRAEKLAESLGVTKLSRSQVSVMAAELDEMVAGFRNRQAGQRPVRVHVDRRADPEGPRGRADGERACPGRDGGEREREPGDPRHRRRVVGGRGGVAGVPARPGRPRPVRRAARHQRLPLRAPRRHRLGAARRVVAALPDALPQEPAHQGPEISAAAGTGAGPHHLRAARRRQRPLPARPGRHRPGSEVPAGRRAPGRGPQTTSSRSPPFPARSGARSGRATRRNG